MASGRKPQSGDGTPPTKYDVRGSTAITDQAHNVVTVWANKAKAERLDKDANDIKALAEQDAVVSVEKQRNGPFEGRLKLWCDEGSFRFTDDRFSAIDPYPIEDEFETHETRQEAA